MNPSLINKRFWAKVSRWRPPCLRAAVDYFKLCWLIEGAFDLKCVVFGAVDLAASLVM